MVSMNKSRWTAITLCALTVWAAGCGSGSGSGSPGAAADQARGAGVSKPAENAKAANKDPVSLSMYVAGADISDSEVAQYFIGPLKESHPHISLEVVREGQGKNLPDLLAAGQVPDIIYTSNANLNPFKRSDVLADLTQLAKKNGMDLQRFEKNGLDAIRMYGDKGELYGIPFAQNVAALIYNKDMFDKLAVPYPKDGMNWDEVYALAQKMTKAVDGTQYIGIDPGSLWFIGSGMSPALVDPKSNESTLGSEEWKRVIALLKQFYDIPGYVSSDKKFSYGQNGFIKDKTMSMYPIWASSILASRDVLTKDINWDLVQLPNFKEFIGRGREIDLHMLGVSKTSKHQEEAFQVVAKVTSDAVQMNMSKNGRISVLNNSDIQKAYGSDVEMFKGKNIQALFKAKPGPQHPITLYDKIVRDTMNKEVAKLAVDKLDVNTYSRLMKEAADKAIQEELKK
jgi:multiple sugar transport system substrate-binding protein